MFHCSSTLSSTMTLQRFSIFGQLLSPHIGLIQCIHLLLFKSTLNIKLVPGNCSLKLKEKKAIFQANRDLLILPLKVLRELQVEMCNCSKTIKIYGCHFWKSQRRLKQRSILHKLPIPTPRICGKCLNQSILTQADLGAHQELKYLVDMTKCIPTWPCYHMHPCSWQAKDVSNLPW